MRAVGRIAKFLLLDDDLNREREYYYHLSALVRNLYKRDAIVAASAGERQPSGSDIPF